VPYIWLAGGIEYNNIITIQAHNIYWEFCILRFNDSACMILLSSSEPYSDICTVYLRNPRQNSQCTRKNTLAESYRHTGLQSTPVPECSMMIYLRGQSTWRYDIYVRDVSVRAYVMYARPTDALHRHRKILEPKSRIRPYNNVSAFALPSASVYSPPLKRTCRAADSVRRAGGMFSVEFSGVVAMRADHRIPDCAVNFIPRISIKYM